MYPYIRIYIHTYVHIYIYIHTYIRTYIQLMAQLKKGGFGNTKMFTADDLKNMSPDEMSDKVRMNVCMYVLLFLDMINTALIHQIIHIAEML